MKSKRHSEIIEIVKNQNIGTQEELTEILRNKGFSVTQATVSRDIKELNLNKILSKDGKSRYTVFDAANNPYRDSNGILSRSIVSIDYAQNILVIKTLSGMAMAAAALLDEINFEEIVGTIAGDDTIFCVVKDQNQLKKLMDKLKSFTLSSS